MLLLLFKSLGTRRFDDENVVVVAPPSPLGETEFPFKGVIVTVVAVARPKPTGIVPLLLLPLLLL